jgi:hypothetical protein
VLLSGNFHIALGSRSDSDVKAMTVQVINNGMRTKTRSKKQNVALNRVKKKKKKRERKKTISLIEMTNDLPVPYGSQHRVPHSPLALRNNAKTKRKKKKKKSAEVKYLACFSW